MIYYPDNWVLLKINRPEGAFYKVLAGWSGGYLDGDYWRLNSGVTRVEETESHYIFYGSSGSAYHCHRGGERISNAIAGVYNSLVNNTQGIKVEMVDARSFEGV